MRTMMKRKYHTVRKGDRCPNPSCDDGTVIQRGGKLICDKKCGFMQKA
jgi:hypothetical protein